MTHAAIDVPELSAWPPQRRRGIFGAVGGEACTSGGAVRSKLKMRRTFLMKPPPGPGLCCHAGVGSRRAQLKKWQLHGYQPG